jgi:lysozyme
MAVNDATIRLITEFEGFVPTWYKDPVGIWTVAFGHTDAAGKPTYAETVGDKFTREQGMDILRRDLEQYEAAVDRHVTVPLNANQRGALTSFTYNLGEGNLKKSTLLKKLNAGDYDGASKEFYKWNKAGGKILAGLTRRREAERQLFVAPVGIPASTYPADVPDEVVVNTPKSSVGGWIVAAILLAAAVFAFFTIKIG